MVRERTLCRLAVGVGIERERVLDVNPLDDEDAVLCLDLADCLTRQPPFSRLDLTRLQRASEGAGQSAAGGRDHVVERRRPLDVAAAGDAVVVCDLVVNAELDRLLAGREIGAAQRTADALDADAGPVDDVSHRGRSYRAVGATPGRRGGLPARVLQAKRMNRAGRA